MNATLEYLNIDPMHYLCSHGYCELFIYYLPIFMINYFPLQTIDISTETILLETEPKMRKILKKNTPIQVACENGHIGIVTFVFNYFKNKENIPEIFDIEHPTENKGENCALIACRKGNLAMIKLLHKVCKANFFKQNAFRENALIICLTGHRKNLSTSYFDCIYYLIETIGIDIKYMYEEILLLATNESLICYLEKKLFENGIPAKKIDIELTNKIDKNYFSEEDENHVDDMEFILKQEEVKKCDFSSFISSIKQKESVVELQESSFF